MIKIEERSTVKLPGITSLFVSFDFNKQIVEELKLLNNTYYDADNKEWEIPLTSLTEFVDRVCKLDQISLYLAQDVVTGVAEVNQLNLDTYRTTPFDYQQEGIAFGLAHDSWLLLDAPGLGKSLQLIYLAEELKRRNNIEHCLIICGINTLKTNWKTEIEKHSSLDCTILGQRINRKGQLVVDGIEKRLQQLNNPIDEFFVITNVESLRSDKIINALIKGPNSFDMIIVDEIHTCFTYDTLVHTDKGNLKIGDIVTQNIDCCVYSYNHHLNIYEYKPILSRFKNSHVSQLIELEFDNNGEFIKLRCTPDHRIFTKNKGYICACDLTEEDDVLLTNIV